MDIRLKHVKKTFMQTKVEAVALRGVDLEIPSGEFVVVLGPSGSGKSTLLNVMGGLDSVSEGEITIGEENIAGRSEKGLLAFRRDHLGFVFQQYYLLSTLTVAENVETGAYGTKDAHSPMEALRMVLLEEHADKYPYELSGGEQQRVAIARALVKKPKILFCDEPTGSLDEETGKEVLKLLKKIHTDLRTTIVLVTHNKAIASIADRVVTLTSGEIVADERNEKKVSPDEIHWH